MKRIKGNTFQWAVTSAALLGLGLALPALAAEPAETVPYLLKTCPVSGGELGSMGDPITKVYDGQEVKFCCGGCPAKFEANRAKYEAQMREQIIADQKPHYALDTCPVSGKALAGDSMMAVDYVYRNRLIRFCCKDCIAKFLKAPEQYLPQIDKATVAKQVKDYPLDRCVVSGERLPSQPIDYVVGNRLVRLCCADCVDAVKKNPGKYLEQIDKAGKGEVPSAKDGQGHGAEH